MFPRLSPSIVMLCVAGLIVGLSAGIDWLVTPSAPKPWPGQAAMDRVLPDIVWKQVPLRDAFDRLSRDSGLVIRFSPEAERRLDVAGPITTIFWNANAAKVLVTLINRLQGDDLRYFSYIEEPDGSVLILHPDDSLSRFVFQRFWVGDLLLPERVPESEMAEIRQNLIDFIRDTKSPRSWTGAGGKGTVEISNDQVIIVYNTSDVCRQVAMGLIAIRWTVNPVAEQVWMRAP